MSEKLNELLDKILNKLGVFFGWIIISPFVALFYFALLAYPVALYKWISTEHEYFWEGLKELVLALTPIFNIFYAWEYLSDIFIFIIGYAILLYGLIVYAFYYLGNL